MSIEQGTEMQTYLSFKLNKEVYAINVSRVINILEMHHITKIPKAPDYMKGVINLRGTVLPVADLRIKFGLPEKESTVDTSIIVISIDIEGEPVLIGIQVDAVKEVLELKSSEISSSPTIGAKYNSDFIEGMWRTDQNFIIILDINKVFSIDEVIDFNEQMGQPINNLAKN
jgi:purine-binding chemotaxis protein CheW